MQAHTSSCVSLSLFTFVGRAAQSREREASHRGSNGPTRLPRRRLRDFRDEERTRRGQGSCPEAAARASEPLAHNDAWWAARGTESKAEADGGAS